MRSKPELRMVMVENTHFHPLYQPSVWGTDGEVYYFSGSWSRETLRQLCAEGNVVLLRKRSGPHTRGISALWTVVKDWKEGS
jgi:hypothetical protein